MSYLAGCACAGGLGCDCSGSGGLAGYLGDDTPWWQQLLNVGAGIVGEVVDQPSTPTVYSPSDPGYYSWGSYPGGYPGAPVTTTSASLGISSNMLLIGGALLLLLVLKRK
jgi:hypothetical protein